MKVYKRDLKGSFWGFFFILSDLKRFEGFLWDFKVFYGILRGLSDFQGSKGIFKGF